MKIITILICSALTLLSCKRILDSCSPPMVVHIDNYKNIDWENYNSIWDVFANNNLECSDSRVSKNNGRSIKVYGWLMIISDNITMTHDSAFAVSGNGANSGIVPIDCTNEILTAITANDITRRCFLTGELKLEKIQDGKGPFCCQMGPRITLKNINDIYFE